MTILTILAQYGVFRMARDDTFFSWPPSPQLAAAAFPYLRAAYNNLYHEFVCSYERKWERRIAGLPEPAPETNRRERREQRRARQQDAGNDPNRNNGIVGGLLGAAIDMLDIPDVAVEVEVEEVEAHVGDDMAHLEIIIDEMGEAAEEEERANAVDAAAAGDEGRRQHQPPAAPQQPAQPAPAPRQRGLQASLRDITNALASTLLLPMISAGMGELIRLALPKHLTTPPGGFGRFRVRTGLLQDQWGRNLVGGCMYIVLRDAFRLYTKYRMAQNKPLRKVRNVDRRRG